MSMKTFATIFLLSVMCLECRAQQSCPLMPTQIKDVGSQISVSLRNTSGKQITSYQLGIMFQDVNGGKHAFPQHFADNVALTSHSRRTAIWHSAQANSFLFPLANIYLLDATFADGTEWLDDGSHSCSTTSVQE